MLPRCFLGENVSASIKLLRSLNIEPSGPVFCEDPIFILSPGWRNGSTLLQRLICSSPGVVIWGEPFERRFPIGRLASMFSPLYKDSEEFQWSIEGLNGSLQNEWIANLNPGLQSLSNAARQFVEEMLAEPARKLGYSKWGAKWVRMTGHYALFLQWMYPKAKFIFVLRNPLEAFYSYSGKNWSLIYPSYWVKGAYAFFQVWVKITKSFLEVKENLNYMIVSYEDLISNSTHSLNRIEDFLSIPIDPKVLDRKIGGTKKKKKPLYCIPLFHLIAKPIYNKIKQLYDHESGYHI